MCKGEFIERGQNIFEGNNSLSTLPFSFQRIIQALTNSHALCFFVGFPMVIFSRAYFFKVTQTWNLRQFFFFAVEQSGAKLHEPNITAFNGPTVSASSQHTHKYLRQSPQFARIC